MSVPPLPGGHLIPQPAAPAPAPRPRRRGLKAALWSGAAAVVVAGACTAVQLMANLGYDDALDGFDDAAAAAQDAKDSTSSSAASLDVDGDWAAGIAEADSGLLMPAEQRTALDDAIADAAAIGSEVEEAVADGIPSPAPKPVWPWELFGEASELDGLAAQLSDRSDGLDALGAEVADANAQLVDAAVAASAGAAEAAAGFEADHVNARNPEIVQLRYAAEAIEDAPEALSADAMSRYRDLEDSAAAVLETEKAELAEKQGPLQSARVEIEAFARDLAPGVLLDFDWSPTVRGYDGPSYGGWTQWWYADPGYATIALSDYVAEEWPSVWTKALVAHEVGHAISVKCPTLYDSSDQDTIEEWATAWALGMGFTDGSNGSDEYGRPSQAMVDAAKQCR